MNGVKGIDTMKNDVVGDAEVGESEGVVEENGDGGGGDLCGDGGLRDRWTGVDGGAEQNGEETTRITREAREQGLVVLSCGIYGNVIRILVPFAISDDDLERGLGILERVIGG